MKNDRESLRANYVNDTDWYRFDIDTLCRKFGTDREQGLTDEAVKAKKAVQGKNDIFPVDESEKDNAPKTAFSVLSVLLIICLVLSAFLLGDKSAPFGVILTVAGYLSVLILFSYSKKYTSRMAEYSTPEVRVIRGGKVYRINQKNLLQGDLVYLCEGDLVPCDGRIVSENGLKVLEKNISGGDGVKDVEFENKLNGLDAAEQKSMVFARSAVSEGSCYVIVCDTGSHTLAVRRGIKAKATGSSALEVFSVVSKLSRIYSIICSVVVFAITALSFVKGGEAEIFSTFVLMLSVAASSYCELLCTLVYIAVSYGISPVHSKDSVYNTGIVIKNLSAVSRLRKIDRLIVPKTAGICEKHIEAEKIFTNNRELEISEENADKLRRTVYVAISTFGGRERHGKKQTSLTSEQDAMTELAGKLGYTIDDVEKSMIPHDFAASDGEQLFDIALVEYKEQYMLCLRGSATQIVNRCSRRISNGAPVPMFADDVADLLSVAENYEGDAYRVTAIATKPSRYNNLDRVSNVQDDLCFEGFIIMREPFSPECAKTVADLESLGIKTVMFCDDMTAQSVNLAKHLGICRDDAQMLSAPEFVNSNLNIIDLKMESYRLFRGMGNRQKRYIADSYLAAGEHIGVIGQHLFDVSLMNGTDTVGFAANLTLSEKKSKNGAEITPSYSSDGSEALKRAADVVIRPADRDGRGGIVAAYDAILKARKVCNNVRNILFYVIASNVARLLIALVSLFFGVSGMSPAQMIFSGIVVDLLAVICIFNSDNKMMAKKEDLLKKASEEKLKTVMTAVISGLVCGLLAVGGSLLTRAYGLDSASASAVCFTSMILLQLCGVFELMRGKYKFFDGMSNIYIICGIILLEYLLLSAIFPAFFAAYLTGTAYIGGIFVCLIPVAVFIITCAVMRTVRIVRQKRGVL